MTSIFIQLPHHVIELGSIRHIALKDGGHDGATLYLADTAKGIALTHQEIDWLLTAMIELNRRGCCAVVGFAAREGA